jgi:hypothetical protein
MLGSPGQVFAILEELDQVKAQLALAEAEKAKFDAGGRVADLSAHRFEEGSKLCKTMGTGLQGRERVTEVVVTFHLGVAGSGSK